MWKALRLLTGFLCAQGCLGKSYRAMVIPAVDGDGLHLAFPESAKYGVNPRQESAAVNPEEYGLENDAVLPGKRELQDGVCVLIIKLVIASVDGLGFSSITKIEVDIAHADPVLGIVSEQQILDIAPNGDMVIRVILTAEAAEVCGTGQCITLVATRNCVSGDCDNYDAEVANRNSDLVSAVCGDPHMVGLLGQKIDWAGEDGGWYCLVSDGEDFQLNVRVSAPMSEEFPERQLVSGVSLLLSNGHSLVVEVKDPYTIGTDGCMVDNSSPCLADGALRILVDNEEAPDLQIPAEKILVAEGVQMSATNLPAECRPFGGDRIWAAKFEQMTASRRSLSEASIPLDEWVLKPDTLAAPTWCAKYLEDGATKLLDTQTNHATLRIETPMIDLRVNIGINHQELVLAADGSTVVPELEFWQTDIQLERHHFSNTVGGMLGDTSRFNFDSGGKPIREGLSALHGPVKSYRVADALGVDFEQLNYK